jgi:hypothetical protein
VDGEAGFGGKGAACSFCGLALGSIVACEETGKVETKSTIVPQITIDKGNRRIVGWWPMEFRNVPLSRVLFKP